MPTENQSTSAAQWRASVWQAAVAKHSERKPRFQTTSEIELDPIYGQAPDGGWPGEYPFTRGIRPSMYRGRFWTMRQYAGFSSAKETNERFRLLLDGGQTGLSVAFDLPTQLGYDSDDPLALPEVGKVGVPVNTLAGIGPWEAGWTAGYVLVGVDQTAALASAVVSHGAILAFVSLLGGLGWVLRGRGPTVENGADPA